MKRLLKIAFSLLMLMAVVYACKKEPLLTFSDTYEQEQSYSIDKDEINRALLDAVSSKSGEKGGLFSTWETANPMWGSRNETLISGKTVSFIPLANYNNAKTRQFLMAYKDETDQVHLKIQGYWSNSQEVNPTLSMETFSGGMFQINPDGYTQNEFLVTNGKITGKYTSPLNAKLKEDGGVYDNGNEWWLWLPSGLFVIENTGDKNDLCVSCPPDCECTTSATDDIVQVGYNTSTYEVVWVTITTETGEIITIFEKTDFGGEGCGVATEVLGAAALCNCLGSENNGGTETETVTDINNNTIGTGTGAGGGSSTTGWEEILNLLIDNAIEEANDIPLPYDCFEQPGVEDAFMTGLGSIETSQIAQLPAMYMISQWGNFADNIISNAFYRYSTNLAVNSIWEGLTAAENSPNGTAYEAAGFNQALHDAVAAVIVNMNATHNNNPFGGEETPCEEFMTLGAFMEGLSDFVEPIEELRDRVRVLQDELDLSDDEADWLLKDEKILSVIEKYLELTGGTFDDVNLIKGLIDYAKSDEAENCQVGVGESFKKSLVDCTEQQKINRFKFAISMQNQYNRISECSYNDIKWDRIFKDYPCDNYTDNCGTYDGLSGVVKSKQADGTYIDIPVEVSFSGGPALSPGLNEQYLGNNKYKYGFRRPSSNNYELLAFYVDEEFANLLSQILSGN